MTNKNIRPRPVRVKTGKRQTKKGILHLRKGGAKKRKESLLTGSKLLTPRTIEQLCRGKGAGKPEEAMKASNRCGQPSMVLSKDGGLAGIGAEF